PGGDSQKIEALYLRTVSRKPTEAELKRWTEFVNQPREAITTDSPTPPDPRDRFRPGKQAQGNKRGPGPDPLNRITGRFQTGAQTPKQQAYEDLFWALLNSSEFIFNH